MCIKTEEYTLLCLIDMNEKRVLINNNSSKLVNASYLSHLPITLSLAVFTTLVVWIGRVGAVRVDFSSLSFF
jgi:hypothetical protein